MCVQKNIILFFNEIRSLLASRDIGPRPKQVVFLDLFIRFLTSSFSPYGSLVSSVKYLPDSRQDTHQTEFSFKNYYLVEYSFFFLLIQTQMRKKKI